MAAWALILEFRKRGCPRWSRKSAVHFLTREEAMAEIPLASADGYSKWQEGQCAWRFRVAQERVP